MIIKSYSLDKIDIKKERNKFFLLYGQNQGFKNEAIKILTKNEKAVTSYDEKDILENFIDYSFFKSTAHFITGYPVILSECTSQKYKHTVMQFGRN